MDETEPEKDNYVWLYLRRNSMFSCERQKFWQLTSIDEVAKGSMNWETIVTHPNPIEHKLMNAYRLCFDHYIGWFGGCDWMNFRFCQEFWQILVFSREVWFQQQERYDYFFCGLGPGRQWIGEEYLAICYFLQMRMNQLSQIITMIVNYHR